MTMSHLHSSKQPQPDNSRGSWLINIVRPHEVTVELADALSVLTSELSGKPITLSVSDVEEISHLNDLVIAVVGGSSTHRVVGMAVLVKMQLPQGMRLLLESVVVSPNYRKRGVASTLMNFIVSHARQYSKGQLSLTCNPSRKDALRLYKSLGFSKANTNVYRLPLSGDGAVKREVTSTKRRADPNQQSLAL